MVAVVPLSLSVTAFLSLPAHYMHTTLSFLFSCLSSLSRVFVSLFVFLCLLTATHMGWHRIKHYSMDKWLWRKVMSRVDLHVCLHVCEGKRRDTQAYWWNTVAICSEQTVKYAIFSVTETLEEEFTAHLVHIWELVWHHLLLFFFPLLSQTSPPCSTFSL